LTLDDALFEESSDSNVGNKLLLLVPQGAPSSEVVQPKSSAKEGPLETPAPPPTEDPLLNTAAHHSSPLKTAEPVPQEQSKGASKARSPGKVAAISSSELGVTAETKAVIPQQRSNGDAEWDAGKRASLEAIPVRPVAGPPLVAEAKLTPSESGVQSIGQVASSEQPFVAASDTELTVYKPDGVVRSGLVSTPALATPPGVAGVFFRPKRVAWVRGTAAECGLGGEQSTKVPVPLERSTAARDISPGLEAGKGRPVSALEKGELFRSPPNTNPVLNPRGDAHSPSQSSPPETKVSIEVDALTPVFPSSPPSDAATVGTVSPAAAVPVSNTPPPSVEREGGMTAVIENEGGVTAVIESEGGVTAVPENVTSPPLARAASMFSSPASKNQAPLEAPSSHSCLGDKSPFLGLHNAVPPPRPDAPPAAQEAEDAPEAVVTPVVARPLFSASSFFSPRAANRAAVEDTKTSPKPSATAQNLQAPRRAASEEPKPFPEPSPKPQTPSKPQPRATSPPAIYTTRPSTPQEQGGFRDILPAEPGLNLREELLAPLSPSSPRLASASSFFSPQAQKKPTMQGVARSLFSTREPAEAGVFEPTDIDEVSGEGNEQVNGKDDAEVIEVPNAEVMGSPKRVDSPPPSAAASFFSPQRGGPPKSTAEQLNGVSGRFGSRLRGRSEDGYLMQTQENRSAASILPVGFEVSAVTSSLEANPSDQSGGSSDEVRPVSPAPPSAAGFFSPSKRSLSGAFKRTEISKFPTDASHGGLVLESALLRTEQSTVSAYNLDQGGEATPYASANCSPMSFTGSSPRYGGVVPSRRVWEVLGEDMARHVEASYAVNENEKWEQAEVGDWADGVAEAPLSGQQDAATWQLGTTAVVDVRDALPGTGQEKRTELGSCHVLDWESPDHQKVRTPPYRSGVGALTQRKAEGGVAVFPSLTGGAQTEKDEEDKNGVELPSVEQKEKPLEAALEETPQDSALRSPNGRVEGEAVPIPNSQSDPPPEQSHSPAESPAKCPSETPPMQRATDTGAPNRVAVLDGDNSAQFAEERWTAVGAEQASPSPSKHGLWSTLLGGLRGMVTPPKVTPPKLAVLKSAGKPGGMKVEFENRADVTVSGGTFRPRWASPLKEAQGARTPPAEKGGLKDREIGPMADSALEEAAHSRLVTL
jgi:hypothetical protein